MFGDTDHELLLCRLAPSRTGDYASAQIDRVPVDVTCEATLVSSLVPGSGDHEPFLDIDYPTAVTVGARPGTATVWIDGLSHIQADRARGAFAEAGLLDTQAQADAQSYAAVEDVVDGRAIASAMAALGSAGRFTFAELIGSASNALRDSTGRLPHCAPPHMPQARALALSVPAMALPSTHNWHLYVNATLPWSAYLRLLEGLAEACVIEEGYLGASASRGATHLRLPWVHKLTIPSPDAGTAHRDALTDDLEGPDPLAGAAAPQRHPRNAGQLLVRTNPPF